MATILTAPRLAATPEAAALAPAAVPAAAPHGLAITLRGLRKAFGETQVLKGIDLHIPPGQFVAVVGRSGCGKSTLLRLIVGLDEPTDGEIQLTRPGRQVSRIMFQEPRLLPWARVLSNVEVGLDRRLEPGERHRRAARTLRAVGLESKGGEWPAVLSGGQKQRVALARALVSGPRLLAFDEPLGALDALTRIEMQQLVEKVWLEQGFTALLVTHDVAEALALADRVLLVEEGQIVLDVTVDLPRPRHRGSPRLAALEGQILDRIIGDGCGCKA